MPETSIVLDAFAWVAYFDGSDYGRRVAPLIENPARDMYTSAATVAEVVSKFLRTRKDPAPAIEAIGSLSTIVPLSGDIANAAGRIHAEAKKINRDFGMLDAFVVATARYLKARILTEDDDFSPFSETMHV